MVIGRSEADQTGNRETQSIGADRCVNSEERRWEYTEM
ncbi:hypothetical protein SJ05684_c19120 [Sinorhizobium sojae CCBAU 05684]|uniref:Uncharacterized protein n=1 Tax=Sinorhizobium sojae CCBAU 05684 TaxID=716928 RepID=A0A249PCG1_9HYPH|nr:hypothetical protein SJ05684_c19120 [Sinorhizobium sojae CCBAU 05684]